VQRFKATKLQAPDFKEKNFGKKIDYDFSTSVFSKEAFSLDTRPFEEKVSFKKPQFLSEIQTEPKYFLDYDQFKEDQ